MIQFTIVSPHMEIISSSSLPFKTSKNSMKLRNLNLYPREIFYLISSHILSRGLKALNLLALGQTAFKVISYSVPGSF